MYNTNDVQAHDSGVIMLLMSVELVEIDTYT